MNSEGSGWSQNVTGNSVQCKGRRVCRNLAAGTAVGAVLSVCTHTRSSICFRRFDCRGKASGVFGPKVRVADVALGDLTVEAKPLWRSWVSGPKVQVADVALEDLTVEAKPLWRFWVSGPKVKVADVALGDLTVEAKPFVAVLGVWGF